MTERWFHSAGSEHASTERAFDPIREGEKYRLPPEVSLEIWERICAGARADAWGAADIADAEETQRRFHELAAQVAARGGRLRPEVGKRTRVDVANARARGLHHSMLDPHGVGKTTRVDAATHDDEAADIVDRDEAASRTRVVTANGAVHPTVLGPSALAARSARAAPVADLHVARSAEPTRADVDHHMVTAAFALIEDRRSGEPLPPELAQRLATELGVDLSRVRIHTDERAARITAQLGARAIAVRNDLYFAAGEYAPTTKAGVELIAHEVMHVAQSARGVVALAGRAVSHPHDAHEREADRFAAQFAAAPTKHAAQTSRDTQSPLTAHAAPPHPPIAAPSEHSTAERIDRSADPASPDAMWQQLFHGSSIAVGKFARVAAPKGIVLKLEPAPRARPASSVLPFDREVFVVRATPHDDVAKRWAFVVAHGAGSCGFIEERFLALDPPEPNARLHAVTAHQTLGQIVAARFGENIAAGNDARLYAQAIYELNRGRPGIRMTEVVLPARQTVLRREAEEETVKVYRGVQVLANQAIWIPSKALVELLKSTGKITTGSTEVMKLGRFAKDATTAFIHGLEFDAGLLVGVLEGAWLALVDIFKSSWELVTLIFKGLYAYFTGTLAELLISAAKTMKQMFEQLDAEKLLGKLGDYIVKRWTTAGWFGKGEFIGEIVGYIALNILLVVLTGGSSAALALARAAKGGSKLARAALAIVKVADTAQNPLQLLKGTAKGLKVGENISEELVDEIKRGVERERTIAQKVEQGADEAEEAAKRGHAEPPGEPKLEAPKIPVRSQQVIAELDNTLPPDLKGRLVENSAIDGAGVRVSYRQGVQIEIGPTATAREIAWHVATAQMLARFEGPLGRIRQLLNAIAAKLGLADKYGTLGFEAQAEIAKLTAIKRELEAAQQQIEATFVRYGEAANIASRDADTLRKQLAGLEDQLKQHESALRSLEPGRGFVAAEDFLQRIKSVAGGESKQALKKYAFAADEQAEVLARVREKSGKAGEEAYQAAIAAKPETEAAHRKASDAVSKTAQAEARREAVASAERKAEEAIRTGSAFKNLDDKAKERLAAYQNGAPFEARRLSSSLAGKSEKEFLDLMAAEVAAGKVPPPRKVSIPGPIENQTQQMHIWEYPDGSEVRFKPLGDTKRPGPGYSIEIKKDEMLPDRGRQDAAFKIDRHGRAAPKNDRDLANPYKANHREQHKAFEDMILGSVHFLLR